MESKNTKLLHHEGRGVQIYKWGFCKKIKPNYLLQPYWINVQEFKNNNSKMQMDKEMIFVWISYERGFNLIN